MGCNQFEKEYKRGGVFGIPISGTNHTIEEYIKISKENGVEFIHLSPMDMIRERLGDRKLSTMADSEKRKLVKEVRDEIGQGAKDHNIVIELDPEFIG